MLNRKGFAITSILYGIMVLFLMVLLALLGLLKIQDNNLERSVNKINDKFCNMKVIDLTNMSNNVNITETCKYKVIDSNNNFCGVYYLKDGDSISLFPNFSVMTNEVDITDMKISCKL